MKIQTIIELINSTFEMRHEDIKVSFDDVDTIEVPATNITYEQLLQVRLFIDQQEKEKQELKSHNVLQQKAIDELKNHLVEHKPKFEVSHFVFINEGDVQEIRIHEIIIRDTDNCEEKFNYRFYNKTFWTVVPESRVYATKKEAERAKNEF